jgi:aerobic-type carbon monoxide dehydrogenase small subunit (CoxS/CutS family)
LLNENQDPGDDEIRKYLSGNLCRCGSYQNILSAVKRASKNRMGFGL